MTELLVICWLILWNYEDWFGWMHKDSKPNERYEIEIDANQVQTNDKMRIWILVSVWIQISVDVCKLWDWQSKVRPACLPVTDSSFLPGTRMFQLRFWRSTSFSLTHFLGKHWQYHCHIAHGQFPFPILWDNYVHGIACGKKWMVFGKGKGMSVLT